MYNISTPEDISGPLNLDIISLKSSGEISILISENFKSLNDTKRKLVIASPSLRITLTSNKSIEFFDYFQFEFQINTIKLFLSFSFSEITELFQLQKIEEIFTKLGIYNNNNSQIIIYLNFNCTINSHGANDLNLQNNKVQVLSINDDVKYFFSFSEFLNTFFIRNTQLKISVLNFKDFKFNRNEKIKIFFNFIHSSNAIELSLTNIAVEILLKTDNHELKHFIDIGKDGKVYFNIEDYLETKIERLKVINCPLMNLQTFEGIINNNLKYLYIDRNSFAVFRLKIEKIIKENNELSLTFDDDIEDEDDDSTKMEIDDPHLQIKHFFYTSQQIFFNKIKFKNFTPKFFDESSTQNIFLKIRKLFFVNCSADFINSFIDKIDLTIIEDISLKEINIEEVEVAVGFMKKLSNLQKKINFYLGNVFFECSQDFFVPVNSLVLNYDMDLIQYLNKKSFSLFSFLVRANNNFIQNITFENKAVQLLLQSQIINNNNSINIEKLIFKNCYLNTKTIKTLSGIFNFAGIKEMTFFNCSFENKTDIFTIFSSIPIIFDYNSFQTYFFNIPHEKQTIETILFRTFDEKIKEYKERPKDAKPKETFIEFKQVQDAFKEFYNLNKKMIILYNSRKQYINIVLSICYFSRDTKDESFFNANVLGEKEQKCGLSPIFISEEQTKSFQNFSNFFTLIEHKI